MFDSKLRIKTADDLISRTKISPSGCWIWTRCKNKPNGYGVATVRNKCVRAHRLSWELHNGKIPAGRLVLHHCDTPLCVNPSHLFLGTVRDNIEDKIAKGRQKRLKLSDRDVVKLREMFRSGVNRRFIARSFRVSLCSVYVVNSGARVWLS